MAGSSTRGNPSQDVAGNAAPKPYQYPIASASRVEVVVEPEYPAGRGPDDCPSVLRLDKGDIVYVLEQHSSGWWGGHKEGEEKTGWFPGSVAVLRPLSGGESVDYDGDDENSRLALERDLRAVASPQASNRPRQDITALHEKLALEQSKLKEMEAAVCMEREWKEKYSEDVRRLEAEISRIRTERDVEKQERARLEKEYLQKESELCVTNLEVKRLHEERAQKDEQIQQMQQQVATSKAQLAALSGEMQTQLQPSADAAPRRDQSRAAETSLLSERSMAHPTTPQGIGSGGRDDACRVLSRQASSSITRQLFTQPVADDPPLSARQMHRHTSEPVQGLAQSGPSAIAPVRVVSGAPPRPSPRGNFANAVSAHTPVQPWRSHSRGAPIGASPRGAKAIAAMQGIDSRQAVDGRPVPQVRALVSEIERRSTSQTPCAATRSYDGAATPQQRMMGANSRATSATAPVASARTPSHGPPPMAVAMPCENTMTTARGRRQVGESEAPQMSPTASGDVNLGNVVFGMSPIHSRGEKAGFPIRSGHISTPSPQPKVSVQDRIRAFQRQ